MEYKELTKEVDEKNHSLRLQTSDFIFALQSLQLTVLQFLKTIFCVTVTVIQFLKAKSYITTVAFVDLIVGK